MEVWQREREDEGLRREGEPPRADLKVQRPACPAVDLVRGKRFQRRFRLADHGLQVGEGDRADQRGRGEHAGLRGLQPRSEEHTSELQSLMRISYAVFCLKN